MIELIGISSGIISPGALDALRRCTTAVASSRHSHIARKHGIENIIPVAPVSTMLRELEGAVKRERVAVLASGDPLFFGIGRTLISHFGGEALNIHPALSSIQLACACFKIPWDNMKFISLHGREPQNAVSEILRNRLTGIFTDRSNSPDAIAAMLLQRLATSNAADVADDFSVHVAEDLGMESQQLFTGTLTETAERDFSPLNVMIVRQAGEEREKRFPLLGLTEEEIVHSRALITKNEIRAAALHALRLEQEGCMWDIGAGSGSVSIEAASICPGLSIYAIEHKEEQQKNIQENIRKFRHWNINLIKGSAPEALYALPSPQRIFLGGSGGSLETIIRHCASRLTKGGRLVVNAVLEQTAIQAPFIMRDTGLSVSWSRIAVERSDEKGKLKRLNTITVITGVK